MSAPAPIGPEDLTPEKFVMLVERLRDELAHLRKELTATRIAALGLLGVLLLSHFGASQLVVGSAWSVVFLVVVFLSCRSGLGDLEMSLGRSIGVTLCLAAVLGLLLWWRIP